MGQLRVTPEQLHGRAGECRTVSETDIGDVISRLDGLINTLKEEWEGNSASRYYSQYDDLRPSFVSMQQLVAELATALDQEATKFENADR